LGKNGFLNKDIEKIQFLASTFGRGQEPYIIGKDWRNREDGSLFHPEYHAVVTGGENYS